MGFDGTSDRGRRIRVAERVRQTLSNRRADVRKNSFTKCFFCLHHIRTDKHTSIRCGSFMSDWFVGLKIRTKLGGKQRIEADYIIIEYGALPV